MIRMAVALTLCLVLSGMAEAGGANLQSHRAVYDLTLKRSRDGGGISAMTGRLVMEWSGECEGAIVNQRMLTQMTGAGGEQVTSDSTLTTWESSDGLKFRYSSRNQVNGKAAEEIKGNASLEKPGGSGAARFAKPEVKKMALPEGTVFPTEQVIQLVRAAQAGERTRAILLFDGLGADPLYETFSVIGQAEPAAEDREGHKLLSGLRSWPVHA